MHEMIETEFQKKVTPSGSDVHLWLSVLDRAVRDLNSLKRFENDPVISEDPVYIYDFRSLKRWFRSTEMEIGSFRWICNLVEVDPVWALKKLEKQMGIKLIAKSARYDRARSSSVADDVAIAA
ncbi:MAG: hypothetical protein HQL70_05815 [Magnetococcales bacterium]|nr:hypothetical protein [Magnetococcales bacterium]